MKSGILAQKSSLNGKPSTSLNAKPHASFTKTLSSPTKRPFDPASFEDTDSENVDPATLFSPSKKSKNDGIDKQAFKPFTFSLAPSNSTSMPPPPTRLSTPARANISSPRAPLTAPAGRSPKRKTLGLPKNRRVSAPFTRIDPPFASRSMSSLPFSLDAALNGTFSPAAPAAPKSAGATLQESMPKNWFFEIYEDTPEEEAATLMEHSTLTLDLSSDEESKKREVDERGKENIAPDDYDAPQASRPVGEAAGAAVPRVKKVDMVRRKVVKGDEMETGLREPLSDLETEDFFAEGLGKDSHVIVSAGTDATAASSLEMKKEAAKLFATAVAFTSDSSAKKSNTSTPSKGLYDMPVVSADGDVKGDIIVWEDSPSCPSDELPLSPIVQYAAQCTPTKGVMADENTAPCDENIL